MTVRAVRHSSRSLDGATLLGVGQRSWGSRRWASGCASGRPSRWLGNWRGRPRRHAAVGARVLRTRCAPAPAELQYQRRAARPDWCSRAAERLPCTARSTRRTSPRRAVVEAAAQRPATSAAPAAPASRKYDEPVDTAAGYGARRRGRKGLSGDAWLAALGRTACRSHGCPVHAVDRSSDPWSRSAAGPGSPQRSTGVGGVWGGGGGGGWGVFCEAALLRRKLSAFTGSQLGFVWWVGFGGPAPAPARP
jgi:hypothetical protein